MPHAEYSVTINRPPADVFAFLADGENCPQWRSGIVEIKKISGEGVGTTYKQKIRGPGGRNIPADYRVTEYEPDRLLAFETIAGPVRPTGRFELRGADASTVVSFSLDAQLSGFKKLLMGGMVNKTMQSEIRALDRLKMVMESGSPERRDSSPQVGPA